MASLVSESGMATFEARFHVLESIVKSWQLVHEIVVCEVQGGKEGKTKPSENVQAVNDEEILAASATENENFETEDTEDGKSECDVTDKQNRTPPVEKEKKQFRNDNTDLETKGGNLDDLQNNSKLSLSGIKMPPKPEAEVTVIGLPKSKRNKEKDHQLKSFCKLTPTEKETTIREVPYK